METDWSALLKAVFGSAYLMSNLVNYPEVVSTSGCRQQRYSCVTHRRCPYFSSTAARFDHTCAVPAVEEAWPCDVTMTSFPVSGSATPHHWNGHMSTMSRSDAVTNRCFNKAVSSEGFHYKEPLQVRMAFLLLS